MAKKIHQSDIIGEAGINLIADVVNKMGCLWQPTRLEAGIDGTVEIRDPASGEVTNCIIQVQSKATTLPFQAETADSFEFHCDGRDLDYWLNGNAPVVLVVSRPYQNEAYWASIKDRFKDLAARKARKIYFDKRRDRFDPACRAELVKLAIPRDAGIYFAPPPKCERLYSNLLRVSYVAPRIHVADTEHRSVRQLGPRLRELDPSTGSEWILSDKRLISFHDLSEPPWCEVCDRGTLESFDVNEWALSEESGQQRTFVWLLNQSLREKCWNIHVRYDKRFDYYYFRATPDLTPRRVTYESREKNTSRVVFSPYYKKTDKQEVMCYRHSAFQGSFRRTGADWYLEITPTYRYTKDGTLLYRRYEDLLKGLKRLENNPAVLGQVIMWARLLARPPGLFNNDFLKFGDLETFELGAGIDDDAWLKHETAERAEAVTAALAELPLFDP